MSTYKINRRLKSCPNPFYINVAWFHLKRPQMKIENNGTIDGHPIIHVDTGVAQ